MLNSYIEVHRVQQTQHLNRNTLDVWNKFKALSPDYNSEKNYIIMPSEQVTHMENIVIDTKIDLIIFELKLLNI